MTPRTLVLAALLLGAFTLSGVPAPGLTSPDALAQGILPTVFVNTTLDETLVENDDPCQEGLPCTFRRAIRSAQLEVNGAFVTACFDPAEVPGARPCPEGKIPLRKSDPNYDPKIDRWVIRVTYNRPFQMTQRQTFVDFRRMLTWAGPADNKIVVDATGIGMDHAFGLESQNNILAGFEVRGDFKTAAIMIQPSITSDEARNNQIGPGIVLAHMPSGKGINMRGKEATNNKVFGIWCGITGDGTVLSPLADDCIYMEQGTRGNVIGDINTPNILAASEGSGLKIEDFEPPPGVTLEPSRDNELRGNWLGLDAGGNASFGLETGITIVLAPDNRIRDNVISNKRGLGVRLYDEVSGTLIQDNIIGGDPTGEICRGNGDFGIWMRAGPRETRIVGNKVMCNEQGGIYLQATNTRDNTITETRLTQNRGKPITLSQGANRGVRAPTITSAGRTSASGTACPNCTVELFTDPDRQAGIFEGSVVADATGAFELEKPAGFTAPFLSATATDGLSTSELSAAVAISDIPTAPPRDTATPTQSPTPLGNTVTPGTPTPVTPTSPTPTTKPTEGIRTPIYLPALSNGAVTQAVAVPRDARGAVGRAGARDAHRSGF